MMGGEDAVTFYTDGNFVEGRGCIFDLFDAFNFQREPGAPNKPPGSYLMVTINAETLAVAMKFAASVVEKRTIVPILSTVLLSAAGDKLEVAATDLDILYQQRLALDSGGDIHVAVDAHKLASIAGAIDKGALLSMEVSAGSLKLKSGRSRWSLPTLPPDDFPMIARGKYTAAVSLPAADLAGAITRCVWSASSEETRYYLNGIFLHAEAGNMRMAATNGHSLVAASPGVPWPDDAPEIIVPTKLAKLIATLSASADGNVTVEWADRTISLTCGDVRVTGKTIDGSFPDYRRVIPPADGPSIRFNPGHVTKAVRRIQHLDESNARRIKWEARDGAIDLSASSSAGGYGREEIDADCAEAPATAFNPQYLTQMMAMLGGEMTEMHQRDAGAPALFRRVPCDGTVGVIMPMRT